MTRHRTGSLTGIDTDSVLCELACVVVELLLLILEHGVVWLVVVEPVDPLLTNLLLFHLLDLLLTKSDHFEERLIDEILL